MAVRAIWLVFIVFCFLNQAYGDDSYESSEKHIENFKSELEDLKGKLESLQEKMASQTLEFLNRIDKIKTYFEAEFGKNFKDLVKETVAGELGKLSKVNGEENTDDMDKFKMDAKSVTSCEICKVQSEILESKSAQTDREIEGLKGKIEFLYNLHNKGDNSEIPPQVPAASELKIEPSMSSNYLTESTLNLNPRLTSIQTTPIQPTPIQTSVNSGFTTWPLFNISIPANMKISTSSFTQISTAMPLTSTPKYPKDNTNLLLVPLWSSHDNQCLKLDAEKKITNTDIIVDHLDAALCVPHLKKILFGRYSPDMILLSNSDGSDVQIIQYGVKSYGMAIDSRTDTVFLTTLYPFKAINRMTINGHNFQQVFHTSYYSSNAPRAIAVNPNEDLIYASNDVQVFSVKYDGTDMRVYGTGSQMFGLTIDIVENTLYYNDRQNLVKTSIGQGFSKEVTKLGFIPYNLNFKAGKVYFSKYGNPSVGMINPNDGSVPQNSLYHIWHLAHVTTFAICFI